MTPEHELTAHKAWLGSLTWNPQVDGCPNNGCLYGQWVVLWTPYPLNYMIQQINIPWTAEQVHLIIFMRKYV